MQTALIDAMDLDESTSEIMRIMMDTGSQRTHATREISKKLQLQYENTDRVSVSPFGANKPREIVSHVYH